MLKFEFKLTYDDHQLNMASLALNIDGIGWCLGWCWLNPVCESERCKDEWMDERMECSLVIRQNWYLKIDQKIDCITKYWRNSMCIASWRVDDNGWGSEIGWKSGDDAGMEL